MLTTRFDNVHLFVQSHIRAILDLLPVQKESHVELNELVDGVLKHLRALRALRRPTENWDDLIIHVLVSKLDQSTAKEWKTSLVNRQMPTLQMLTDFLQKRCNALEALSSSFSTMQKQSAVTKTKSMVLHATGGKTYCLACKQAHFVYQCEKFRAKSIEER